MYFSTCTVKPLTVLLKLLLYFPMPFELRYSRDPKKQDFRGLSQSRQ